MDTRIDIDALGAELDEVAAKAGHATCQPWASYIRETAEDCANATQWHHHHPCYQSFIERIVAAGKQVLADRRAPPDTRSVAREDFRKAISRAVTELTVAKGLGAQYARQDELMIQDIEAFGEFINVTRQTLDAFIDRINAAEREREAIMRGECRNEPVQPREKLQIDVQDW